MMVKKNHIGMFLAVSAAFSIAACSTEAVDTSAGKQTAAEQSTLTGSHSEASWVIDIHDQRQVAGFADAVFVGKVLEQVGSAADRSAIPETQFRVSVTEALKGELAEEVTVNQQGGTDPKTGEVLLLDDDPLVEVGKTYLFATRYNADLDFYTVIPITGHAVLNDSNARGLQSDDAVERMRDAVANEVPYAEPQPHVSGPNGQTKPQVAPRLSGPPEQSGTYDPVPSGAPTSSATVVPPTTTAAR
ncbi:hypothetical protein [Rhodococcus sp. (in: high G+C Gram-positive bacteria)]|uniref:hypothetical protein n=1 Tax=Rhodococcus sp. TaxID=1831 RepID=UPI003B8A9152